MAFGVYESTQGMASASRRDAGGPGAGPRHGVGSDAGLKRANRNPVDRSDTPAIIILDITVYCVLCDRVGHPKQSVKRKPVRHTEIIAVIAFIAIYGLTRAPTCYKRLNLQSPR